MAPRTTPFSSDPPASIHAAGFSLVELLTVIAVIGIVAAIAIPNLGPMKTRARTTTVRQNARSLVSIYQSGKSAGFFGGETSLDAALHAVTHGTRGVTVRGLTETDLSQARTQLQFDPVSGLLLTP